MHFKHYYVPNLLYQPVTPQNKLPHSFCQYNWEVHVNNVYTRKDGVATFCIVFQWQIKKFKKGGSATGT